jgi:hypothetical protein
VNSPQAGSVVVSKQQVGPPLSVLFLPSHPMPSSSISAPSAPRLCPFHLASGHLRHKPRVFDMFASGGPAVRLWWPAQRFSNNFSIPIDGSRITDPTSRAARFARGCRWATPHPSHSHTRLCLANATLGGRLPLHRRYCLSEQPLRSRTSQTLYNAGQFAGPFNRPLGGDFARRLSRQHPSPRLLDLPR